MRKLAGLEFEHHAGPLAPRRVFYARLRRSVLLGLAWVAFSLAIGMIGYSYFDQLSLVDSFENAAMILSGMGPLDETASDAGKIFAGCYAIYCGFAVIGIAGVIFAPIVHRFLHLMHAADEKDEDDKDQEEQGGSSGGSRKKKRTR